MTLRIASVLLASMAFCCAQTPTPAHHKKVLSKAEINHFNSGVIANSGFASTGNDLVVSNGIIAATSGACEGTCTFPIATSTNTVAANTSITAANTWTSSGDAMAYFGGGSNWVNLNDHNAGVETRPLDNKGPTLAQVDNTALLVSDHDLPPQNYVQLAKAVKMESASTDEAEMLQVIHDHHFRVYDYSKVDNYLYRQALKQGVRVRWVWKPMREADLKPVSAVSPQTQAGYLFAKPYTKRVPQAILEDAKCVLDQVQDAVFLISDFEHVRPDPFLAVSTPKLLAEGKLWIIDRWDEPGFDAPARY